MRRSITTTFFTYVSILASLSVFVLGGALLFYVYKNYEQRSQLAGKTFLEEKKALVRTEVERSIDEIEYLASQTEPVLRQKLSERVNHAYFTAKHLYAQFHEVLPRDRVRKMVLESLRPMRFEDGRGYFFLLDMEGNIIMHADRPELEGNNLLEFNQANVRDSVARMVQVAQEESEGFVVYKWGKPGHEGLGHTKIAYIKYFEPLDILIGSGEYLDDVTRELQERALAMLGEITFNDSGYIFAGTWDGLSLLGPAAGKNVLDATDIHGTKVVQELIQAAKDGGDFVTYVMPPVDPAYKQHTKLSYSMSVPEWQWYVGAGVSMDQLEVIIERNRAAMKRNVTNNALLIGGLLLLLLLLNLAVAVRARSRLSRSFSSFNSFFHQGARGHSKVDRKELTFKEFDQMAILANQMIEGRVHAEHELEKMNRHLEQLVEDRTEELIAQARELEAANQRLRDLDELKSTFLNTVSHDLRTPMTSVLGFAKMVHKDFHRHFAPLTQDNDQLGRYAERIEENLGIIEGEGGRLLRLIGDFLDLSKIEAGRLEWHDTEVDVHDLVKRAVYAVDSQFVANPELHLETNVSPDLPLLWADPDRLQQVLVNLLHNAAKFTPAGIVSLSVSAYEARHGSHAGVRFSVADSGIGIPYADQHRIFDKFQQARRSGDEPPEGVQGTGLGLAICKQIVERYGGRIYVASTPGKGSVFNVELPARMEQQSQQP